MSESLSPEWIGDCRDPKAGCWHVVDEKANSTTADPVHCRKPCVSGSRYCELHSIKDSRFGECFPQNLGVYFTGFS